MVQFLSGSAWSVTMRRIMENIMITLPVGRCCSCRWRSA